MEVGVVANWINLVCWVVVSWARKERGVIGGGDGREE